MYSFTKIYAMQKSKKVINTVLFALLTFALSAQTSIGIRGGLNFANVPAPSGISNLLPIFKPAKGASVALVTEMGIGKNFAIQPELAYHQKGFALKAGLDFLLFNVDVPLGIKAVTKVNYLEAPILGKYKFGSGKVGGYVVAGPTIGYALNGRFTTKAQVLIDIKITDEKLDLANLGYNRFELGGILGAGVNFKTGNGNLFIDARYARGFTNVYDVPFVDLKLKNKGVSINVGMMIPLTSGSKIPRA